MVIQRTFEDAAVDPRTISGGPSVGAPLQNVSDLVRYSRAATPPIQLTVLAQHIRQEMHRMGEALDHAISVVTTLTAQVSHYPDQSNMIESLSGHMRAQDLERCMIAPTMTPATRYGAT